MCQVCQVSFVSKPVQWVLIISFLRYQWSFGFGSCRPNYCSTALGRDHLDPAQIGGHLWVEIILTQYGLLDILRSRWSWPNASYGTFLDWDHLDPKVLKEHSWVEIISTQRFLLDIFWVEIILTQCFLLDICGSRSSRPSDYYFTLDSVNIGSTQGLCWVVTVRNKMVF